MEKEEHYKNVCDAFGFVTGFSGQGGGGRSISQSPSSWVFFYMRLELWCALPLAHVQLSFCLSSSGVYLTLRIDAAGWWAWSLHRNYRSWAQSVLRNLRLNLPFVGLHGVTALPKVPTWSQQGLFQSGHIWPQVFLDGDFSKNCPLRGHFSFFTPQADFFQP